MTTRRSIFRGLRVLAVAAFIAVAALPASLPGLRPADVVLAASGGCSPSSSTCYLFDVRLGSGPGIGTGFGTYYTIDGNSTFTGRIVCHYGNETQTGTCGWGYEVPSPGDQYGVVYKVAPDPGSQVCNASTCLGSNEVNDLLYLSGNYLESSWSFLLISPFQIDMAVSGTGSGTVTSDPPGIDCPDDCSDLYAANHPVTLTAKAASGSVFAGWSGDACTGTSKTCEITTDFLQSVKAKFNKKATAPPATETPTEAPNDEVTPAPTVEATPTGEPLPTVLPATAAPTAETTPVPTAGPPAPAASEGGTAPLIVGLAILLVVLVGGAVFVARRGRTPAA